MRNDTKHPEAGGASMWIVVVVVFGLMVAAWVAMFTIAMRNPVASVPLEHRTDGPSGPR